MKLFLILILLATTGLILLRNLNPINNPTDLNTYRSLEDTLLYPFDTSKVLNMYDFKLKDMAAFRPDDLDTFVLTNLRYACDCPSWATHSELETEQNPLNELENQEHAVFYIETGDESIQVPDQFSGFGNKIRFYGRIRTKSGLPKHGLMDPNPPLGPVLTIYGYEVMLPAKIYGPNVLILDSTHKKPKWACYESTTLEVK